MTDETKFIAIPFAVAWLLLIATLCACVPASLATAQEDGQDTPIPNDPNLRDVTLPEFIVIYDYPVEAMLLNLRVVVRAKSEGEAVMRATSKLMDTFRGQLDTSKLKFIEVAPRVDKDKPKDKK